MGGGRYNMFYYLMHVLLSMINHELLFKKNHVWVRFAYIVFVIIIILCNAVIVIKRVLIVCKLTLYNTKYKRVHLL